jgi:hypothetical protein
MRKLRALILLTIVALLMLVPLIRPTQQVKAGIIPYTYDVYTTECSFDPPPGTLVGQWEYTCFGLTGWGMQDEPCTRKSTTWTGEECPSVSDPQ